MQTQPNSFSTRNKVWNTFMSCRVTNWISKVCLFWIKRTSKRCIGNGVLSWRRGSGTGEAHVSCCGEELVLVCRRWMVGVLGEFGISCSTKVGVRGGALGVDNTCVWVCCRRIIASKASIFCCWMRNLSSSDCCSCLLLTVSESLLVFVAVTLTAKGQEGTS